MLTVAAMVLSACQNVTTTMVNENENENMEQQLQKMFTFHVKGAFSQSQEEMGRAAVRLEEDNTAKLTDLWVLDYVDGTCQQTVHQVSTDADFGHPQMALTYGHHDIKFIASKGAEPVLSAIALSWTKVLDTFCLDYPVDVTASSNGNRAPELKRRVAGIRVVMTDEIPQEANTVDVTWHKVNTLLIPSLACATGGVGTVSLTFPQSYLGQTGKDFSVYTISGDDMQPTDVILSFKDKDGKVLSSVTIPDVEVMENRMTVLKGECFGRGSGFSVSVDDTWLEDDVVEF